MDTKMNPKVKAKWLAALRGGDYMQTKTCLKDSDGFCCLGVLCDIHSKESLDEWRNTGHSTNGYLGSHFTLPKVVEEWAGVTSRDPFVSAVGKTLSGLNDTGKSFAEIADLIEAHL